MSNTYIPSSYVPFVIPQDMTNQSLLEIIRDYNRISLNGNRTSFSHKIGKLAGRGVKILKKDETKVSTLISYWTFETMITTIIIMELTSFIGIVCAVFIYLYGSYALYSAVDSLVHGKA